MFPLFSIDEWWQVLSPAEHVFWIIALVSSLLFVTIFGLSILGLGADSDADVDVDVDTDVDLDMDTDIDVASDIHIEHVSGHDFSVDKEFSAFSIRGIIAFFTFFGWTGVYMLSQGKGVGFSVLMGLLAGSASMFVVAYMIYQFALMEKSGTVNVMDALDSTGEVYLSIPQNLEGKGKIHIVVDGSLHEFDAETNGISIPTGSQVRVIDVREDDILLVEPVILELKQENT